MDSNRIHPNRRWGGPNRDTPPPALLSHPFLSRAFLLHAFLSHADSEFPLADDSSANHSADGSSDGHSFDDYCSDDELFADARIVDVANFLAPGVEEQLEFDLTGR